MFCRCCDKADNGGKKPNIIGIQKGHFNRMQNINICGPDGKTPFMIATEQLHVEAITTLLAWGAEGRNPDVDVSFLMSPFYWAAAYGNIKKMRSLLDEPTAIEHINKQDRHGRT